MGEQDGTSLSQHLALLGGWRFSSQTALEEQITFHLNSIGRSAHRIRTLVSSCSLGDAGLGVGVLGVCGELVNQTRKMQTGLKYGMAPRH
jgi:hypothetical protein